METLAVEHYIERSHVACDEQRLQQIETLNNALPCTKIQMVVITLSELKNWLQF